MKIAVQPTIFIGLGGTGSEVLQKLRQRFVHRLGTADLPFFRWVYLDTQLETLDRVEGGLTGKQAGWTYTNQLKPSKDTIEKVAVPDRDGGATRRDLDIREWFDLGAAAGLSNVEWEMGTGGRRMYGSLGFRASQNLPALRDRLQAFHQQLRIAGDEMEGRSIDEIHPPYMRVTAEQVNSGVQFVVLGSGGGGTGSGCFIDTGYFIRHLARSRGWRDNTQYGYSLIAAPGMGARNHYRNSAGLLVELDHYKRGSTARYNARYLQISEPVEETDPPFDMTFVAQPTRQDVPLADDANAAFERLQWGVAEEMLNNAVSLWGDSVNADEIELPGARMRTAFAGDLGQNPAGVETFGIAAREFPAGLVHRHIYNRVIRQLADSWINVREEVVEEETQALRDMLGIPGAGVQTNREPRPLEHDELKQALLEDVKSFGVSAELNKARARIIREEESRRQAADEDYQAAVEDIAKGFREREGAPAAERPGTIYAIVHSNVRELLAQTGPQSLFQKTADRILDIAARTDAGPATAGTVAQQAMDAANAEARYIEECLSTIDIQRPQNPSSLRQCWQYANDSLLNLVLGEKLNILRSLSDWLSELHLRMQHFAAYVREWAASATEEGGMESASACPFAVLPEDRVQKLVRTAISEQTADFAALDGAPAEAAEDEKKLIAELRRLARNSLPRRNEVNGEPTLFAEGPPLRNGRPDFEPMTILEADIWKSIENGDASPYEIGVVDVVREEANRRGVPAPNLFNEAKPLLNYNAAHADYQRQNFMGAPTYLIKQIQTNQPGYDWLDTEQHDTWTDSWPGGDPKIEDVAKRAPHLNRQLALFQTIRASIQWAYLFGYSRSDVTEAVMQGAWEYPAMTDRRIRPAPSEAELKRARMLFIGSVILEQWTFEGGEERIHRFDYTEVDGTGASNQRAWPVTGNVQLAIRELALNKQIMEQLRRDVARYLRDNEGPAAEAIEKAVRFINEKRKPDGAMPPEPGGDLLRYNLYNVNFDAAESALVWFAAEFEIPRPTVEHEYAEPHDRGEILANGQPANQYGWYCKRCGYLFGQDMPPRDRQCENCSYPFPDSRDHVGPDTHAT